MKKGPAALRVHWRCDNCERELAVDLTKTYDPNEMRCCVYLYSVSLDGREVLRHRENTRPTPVKSWTEEN